jgi:hypothetical protein
MENEKKQIDEKIADALGVDYDSTEESSSETYHKSTRKDIVPPNPEIDIVDRMEQNETRSKEEKLMEIDFIHTRNTLKRLLGRGEEMFEDMYRIAQESDNANSFDVAGKILKHLVESNQSLLDMHEKRQKIRKDLVGKPDLQQNNFSSKNVNIITGTTDDLLRLVQEQQEKIKTVENEKKEDE